MDIRGWPMDQIMQLPDCCFGRRFIVSCNGKLPTGGTAYDISEVAFPERCVIWGVHVWSGEVGGGDASIRLALGDQLPAAAAAFSELEPFLRGVGEQGVDPRIIRVTPTVSLDFPELRIFLSSMGRRLCLEFTNAVGDVITVSVVVVVSSIPREVPDWLISGYPRSR